MIPMSLAKASFIDAVMYVKHKMHTAPNASGAKSRIAQELGLGKNVSYKVYIKELGNVLIENGQKDFVEKILKILK